MPTNMPEKDRVNEILIEAVRRVLEANEPQCCEAAPATNPPHVVQVNALRAEVDRLERKLAAQGDNLVASEATMREWRNKALSLQAALAEKIHGNELRDRRIKALEALPRAWSPAQRRAEGRDAERRYVLALLARVTDECWADGDHKYSTFVEGLMQEIQAGKHWPPQEGPVVWITDPSPPMKDPRLAKLDALLARESPPPSLVLRATFGAGAYDVGVVRVAMDRVWEWFRDHFKEAP